MFDTEKFIVEIQSRESIWNTSSTTYADRATRRKAWEEVAAIMYKGFEKINVKKKKELLQELQKKWKHLRDYFVREKNKELQMKVVVPRKRRAPFLDRLNEFMHVSKTSSSPRRPPEQHQSYHTSPDSLEEIDDTNHKHKSTHVLMERQHGANIANETLRRSHVNEMQSNLDPNMVFLLSVLPEMQTMDDRQAFDFKLEVMKLIKKIKYYDTNYNDSPAGTSTSYHQPYYMFGNQNNEVNERSRNSSTSDRSDQGQSFLPPEICIIEKEENQEDVSAEEEKIM